MKRWWVSWYDTRGGKYDLHSPWWRNGYRVKPGGSDLQPTVVAAVEAETEEDAKAVIIAAHDTPRPHDLEWRFVNERRDDWSPFSERFPRAPWMKWASSDTERQ